MIGAAFQFIAGSKVAQYVVLGLVIAAAVGGYTVHQRAIGREQGQEKQKNVETERVAKDVVKATNEQNADLTKSNQIDVQLQAQVVAAQSQAASALALATQFKKESESLKAKIANLSDPELHQFTVQTLGVRQPEEATNACYTAKEERALANAVAGFPKCQGESAQKDAAITSKDEQITKLLARVDNLLDRDAKREVYAQKLRSALQILHDNHPEPVKAWKCLRIWKCGRGKLEIPDPAVIEAESGKEVKP